MVAHKFDPVTLQILWSRLIGIVDEAAVALVRTSFSQVVQECNDYSCTIMDANGFALADNSLSIPAFIGTMPKTVRHVLSAIPISEWKQGDIVITNDPWMGTGHLLDFSMVAPVFHHERVVAFAGTVAHAVDVGGLSWASHARTVFEEGIRVPIVRLFEAGKPNEFLIHMIKANVRLPDLVMGDLLAQAGACDILINRVREFIDDASLDDLKDLAEAIQSHAERSMRAAIREIHDGSYNHAVTIDGFDEELTVQACLTVAGDTLDMDYAGTSPQVDRGINSVLNYTYAYTAYPLKCALDPHTPKNEGSYNPISVRAPEGSILNPRFPAAVSARHLTGMYCAAAVFGTLAQALPERAMGDSSGPPARPVISGVDANENPFTLIMFPWGGMGARSTKDGLACTAFPGNDNCATVEIMEAVAPVRFHRKQIIRDSGGPGKYQGGAGQELTFEFVAPKPGTIAMMSARFHTPAQGTLGGNAGSLTEYLINGKAPPPNGLEVLQPGDIVTIRYPGGGGYGPPAERNPRAVAQDVADGIISSERARAAYGQDWEIRAAESAQETASQPGCQ